MFWGWGRKERISERRKSQVVNHHCRSLLILFNEQVTVPGLEVAIKEYLLNESINE